MPKFENLDKDARRLLYDINKLYKDNNFYSRASELAFWEKYTGLDTNFPNNVPEKVQRNLQYLAELGYIMDENSPSPTAYGLHYKHYKFYYQLNSFIIPSSLSLAVSLIVNLILNREGVAAILNLIFDFISQQ